MEKARTSFLTVTQAGGPFEIKELGSRFLSYLYPMASAAEADSLIGELRKSHHDATHVCTALRLWRDGDEYVRHNDDGEPAGTAGAPILDEIRRRGCFNLLVGVVRYFGGTKLGTGRLRRAYGRSARAVLDGAVPVVHVLHRRAAVTIPFDFTGDMMRIVRRFSIRIVRQTYGEEGVVMEMSVPLGSLQMVERAVSEHSLGRVRLTVLE